MDQQVELVPAPVFSTTLCVGILLAVATLGVFCALLWRQDAREKRRRLVEHEQALAAKTTLATGRVRVAGLVETPGKKRPVVELRVEREKRYLHKTTRWEIVESSLKTRSFSLLTGNGEKLRVELKRRVDVVGEVVTTMLEENDPIRRLEVAELLPGDRVLIEGELSRDGTGGYRGESGDWVLRAPKEGNATVYLPSAPAAFASRLGAPLRGKVIVVLSLGIALAATASVLSMPLFGADAQGTVEGIYDKPTLSSKSKAKTYQVMRVRFPGADSSEQLCPDMALHFTRDPKVGDRVAMRYLPMRPSVCEAKGPFTFGAFEFLALLLAGVTLLIGLFELRSGRAQPSDRAVLDAPRSKAEQRRIKAALAALRGDD